MHTTEYKRGRWAEEEIAQKRWGGGGECNLCFSQGLLLVRQMLLWTARL